MVSVCFRKVTTDHYSCQSYTHSLPGYREITALSVLEVARTLPTRASIATNGYVGILQEAIDSNVIQLSFV